MPRTRYTPWEADDWPVKFSPPVLFWLPLYPLYMVVHHSCLIGVCFIRFLLSCSER